MQTDKQPEKHFKRCLSAQLEQPFTNCSSSQASNHRVINEFQFETSAGSGLCHPLVFRELVYCKAAPPPPPTHSTPLNNLPPLPSEAPPDIENVNVHLGHTRNALELKGSNGPDLDWDLLDRKGLALVQHRGPHRLHFSICSLQSQCMSG